MRKELQVLAICKKGVLPYEERKGRQAAEKCRLCDSLHAWSFVRFITPGRPDEQGYFRKITSS